MEPVITWALGMASCVFGLGLISAVGSRRKRAKEKATLNTKTIEIVQDRTIIVQGSERPTAMSMAAQGTKNMKEDEFATIGGGSR